MDSSQVSNKAYQESSGHQEESHRWSSHQQNSEQRRSVVKSSEQRNQTRAVRGSKGNSSSISFHSDYDPWKDATITRRGEWKIVTPCPASLIQKEKSPYQLTGNAPEHKFYMP